MRPCLVISEGGPQHIGQDRFFPLNSPETHPCPPFSTGKLTLRRLHKLPTLWPSHQVTEPEIKPHLASLLLLLFHVCWSRQGERKTLGRSLEKTAGGQDTSQSSGELQNAARVVPARRRVKARGHGFARAQNHPGRSDTQSQQRTDHGCPGPSWT